MTTAAAATGIDNLVLTINLETRVRASLEATFAALLEQLGPGFDTPEGKPMPMKLEPWPGGRWYRDLGDGNGHYCGTVQAIKRPTLVEITGPLFMSYAVVSNVQYRLSEVEGGTLIAFHHFALGAIREDLRQNVGKGWKHISERIGARAEGSRP
jgi:hypothetical protein